MTVASGSMSGKNCSNGGDNLPLPARGNDYPAKNQSGMIDGQNHVIGSKVDRVYLLDDYADEKREAWNKLGDRLEAILSAYNVVSLKSA